MIRLQTQPEPEPELEETDPEVRCGAHQTCRNGPGPHLYNFRTCRQVDWDKVLGEGGRSRT